MSKITITAAYFEKRVGHPPENDDLDRCNCDKAGETGHWYCGWDWEADLPQFMTGPRTLRDREDMK